MSYVPLVAVTRGGLEESLHYGAVVLADANGRIHAAAGSPEVRTYTRSSAKPLQALPLLASGAADAYGLTKEEVAIIIGSHNGEPRHQSAVRSILAKIGSSEAALLCGAHAPYHKETARSMERRGERPTPIHNNCSGKHAGMIALGRFRGGAAAVPNYLPMDHPVQREILDVVVRFAGLGAEAIAIGVDGCGVPTFGLPLAAAAASYARLMDPQGMGREMGPAAARAVDAMMTHPEMIGGEGRLDTDLMNAAPRKLIAKAGAEGFYAVGFLREGRGYGLALKIADGNNDRARTAVALRALEDLGVVDRGALESVDCAHLGPVLNRRGEVVGGVEARFRLS